MKNYLCILHRVDECTRLLYYHRQGRRIGYLKPKTFEGLKASLYPMPNSDGCNYKWTLYHILYLSRYQLRYPVRIRLNLLKRLNIYSAPFQLYHNGTTSLT